MKSLVFILGVFLLLLGGGYLCRPDKISAFNSWCRDNLFTDRHLLINRRKTGVLLLFAGAVLLFLFFR